MQRQAAAGFRLGLILLVGWALVPFVAMSAGPDRFDSAMGRGLEGLAGSFDGERFADPYLNFVYEKEQLPVVNGHRVTYRILDAYFMVLMLEEAGVAPGPASLLYKRAGEVTDTLAPIWKNSGIYNLAERPHPGGVALDTYAILAFLKRDRAMAEVVKAALHRDRWLPADYYREPESYRHPADESWALRAILHTELDSEVCDRIARRLVAETRALLDEASDPVARVILVFHMLEMLRELPGETSTATGAFLEEAVQLIGLPGDQLDTLTTANLLATAAQEDAIPIDSLHPLTERLLNAQRSTGLWHVESDDDSEDGSVFTTLRCVLALKQYVDRLDRQGRAAARTRLVSGSR